MAIKRHQLDIYDVELILATNERDWKKLRRRAPFAPKKTPRSAGLTCFAVFDPDDGSISSMHVALWIDAAAHETDSELVATAAHEAAHAAGRIFSHIEHEVDGTDEPSAYLTGWLTRWIFEGVKADA